MLFYSITSLSTSISSSQNVVKFISEHKDCDSVIFANELSECDLENKLHIVKALIFDIIKKYSKTNEEYEYIKKEINNPSLIETTYAENNEFAMIEIKNPITILERIDEPIKLSLLSTAETMHNIHQLLMEIRDKIKKHNESYLKKIVSLCLQIEMKKMHRQTKILEQRLHLLFELMKIYLPGREKM
jgi:hypothetical protein